MSTLVIGGTVLDISLSIEDLPKAGDDIYGKEGKIALGGCGFNVARTMQNYDFDYVLFSPIGKGRISDFIKSLLKESQMKYYRDFDCDMDNGYTLCLVDGSKERTFLSLNGIECNFKKEWFQDLDLSKYDSLYLSGYEIEGEGGDGIIEFLEKNSSIRIYYGIGARILYIDRQKHERIFKLKPIIHINEKECLEYTGKNNYIDGAKYFHNKTNNLVIVTLGEKGAYYFDGKNGNIVPSIPSKVIDTSGAGDSHFAGTIIHLERGKAVEEAIFEANKIAAKVCEVVGSNYHKVK